MFLISLLTQAQITENRTVGNFSKIKVSQGIDVFFTQGEWKPLRIETENQENLAYLKTEVDGNTLKLFIDADNVSKGRDTKQRKKKNGDNWVNFQSMKVFVTAPHVTDFTASSSGSIQFENAIQSDNVTLKASSSGSISGDINCKNVAMEASSSGDITSKLKADKVEADVSSSGDLTLSGTVTTAEIQASSSGDCKAKNLVATNVVIAASSSGSIEITVLESLDAKASSSGDIWYCGNPTKVAKDTSSSGSITKK